MILDYLRSPYHRDIEKGWGAFESGNLEKAEKHFQRVLSNEDDPDMGLPDLIDAHNGVAAVARAHKDFFDAHRLYREAEYLISKYYPKGTMPAHLSWNHVDQRPVLRTMIGLAHTAYLQGKLKEAQKYYNVVLQKDPRDHLGMKRYLHALDTGEHFPDRR